MIFSKVSSWGCLPLNFVNQHLSCSGNEDKIHFLVNEHKYKHTLYLGDGIYPNWPTIIKAPQDQEDPAAKLFATSQEAAHKDIKRAFGVIQIQFTFLQIACCMWQLVDMHAAMMCCIVLHNILIVQDQGLLDPAVEEYNSQTQIVPQVWDPAVSNTLAAYLQDTLLLRDSDAHSKLQQNLTMDLWLKAAGQ